MTQLLAVLIKHIYCGMLVTGWGLDWQVVWTGYLIASGWLVLLLFLSVVALSRRK